jgi:hypothetical protein
MPEPVPACAAWQEHLAAWLVAQIGPDDEVALAAHLRACPTCAGESARLLAVAAVSLGADPGAEPWQVVRDDAPPSDLAERIVARVATERRRGWARRAAVAVAAIAAVVVLAAVLVRDDPSPPAGRPVTFIRLAPGVEADASVAADGNGARVELTATGLDPEVTYALWLTPPRGGYRERVAAGTFRADEGGEVDVTLHSALPADEAARVWATTPDGTVAMDTEPPGEDQAGIRSGTIPAILATAR